MLIHHCQSRSFASKRTYKSSVAAKKHNNDRSAKYCRSSSALTGFTFPFWYGRHHRFIYRIGPGRREITRLFCHKSRLQDTPFSFLSHRCRPKLQDHRRIPVQNIRVIAQSHLPISKYQTSACRVFLIHFVAKCRVATTPWRWTTKMPVKPSKMRTMPPTAGPKN